MEPLSSECPTSQTNIVDEENVECQTSSPVTSYAGSDCSISNTKVVATAEGAFEKHNDVTLTLMGHLIPGSTGLEEDVASETDISIESTPSALKRRLENLPSSSEATKFAERVAAVNRRVRRERNLSLNLRIEEKDEVEHSTTDSSRTVINSESNRCHQGQVSRARARRRERLNSSLAMSKYQLPSDFRLCSSGLSSPEPVTLRDAREDFHEEMNQVSLTVKGRYCFDDDPIINLKRENVGTGPSSLDMPEFKRSYETNFEFEDAYSKEDLISYNSSPEAENAEVMARYLTPKKKPIKFGGYRPTSGLIFRNLSSDSESQVNSEWIARKKLRCENFHGEEMTTLDIQDAEEETIRGRHFSSSDSFSNLDKIMQVEHFPMEKIEVLESRSISPVLSADNRFSFEESNHSQRLETFSKLQIPQKTVWESLSPNERTDYLDAKIRNVVEQSTLVDNITGHFDNGQFTEVDLTDSFSKEDFTYSKIRKISLEPLRQNHVNLSKEDPKTTFPTSRSSQERSLAPETRDSTADLVILNKNHGSEHSHPAHAHSGDDSTDDEVPPKIPPLEIDYSQSQSLSSDARNETTRSSLDVNALIQALSDVSIKQKKNSTYRTNRSIVKLKSPLGYDSKFSGSSGPRSSEYTPAAGGSRQSLTSQEASEVHSVGHCKAELRSRFKVESNAKTRRLGSRSPESSKDLTKRGPTPNAKKLRRPGSICVRDEPLENDLSRGSSFIPVVAKVNKTNLVSPEHPLRVKSISKLISPRRYQSTEFGGKIVDPLTSRTDASQSSEECQKSPCSLKSVQVVSKVPGERIDRLRPSTDSPNQPVTLAGRKILEPLNLVPKIQPDSLSDLNRKLNRRRKTANDLAEIINSHSEAGSGRAACSSRTSPSSQRSRVDLPIHRFSQRRENSSIQPKDSSDSRSKSLVRHTQVLSGRRIPGKPFENISRPSTKHDHGLLEDSTKGGKISCASSERSSVTSGNMYLRSERHSMNSGDYEGRTSWSSPSRDDELTGNNDTYNLEDKLYDQQQRVGANCKGTSGVIDLDLQDVRSPEFAFNSCARESARSYKNCVHLDDLQNGKEVTLPCRDTRRREDGLRERELFEHLPNEISASLTRHGSFGTQVTENSHCSEEIPSTFEDLRKNIQANNDQWLKSFKSDNDLEPAPPGSSSGFSPNDKLVSSASSPVRFRNSHNQSRNLIRNQTKISHRIPFVNLDTYPNQLPPQKIVEPTEGSCFKTLMSSKIDPGSSGCSSPLYRDIRQESEYDSESGQLDSQRSSLVNSGPNSCRNTVRGFVESLPSTTVLKFVETLDQKVIRKNFTRIAEPNGSEFGSFQEKQAINVSGNPVMQDERFCDIEVIANTATEASVTGLAHKVPFPPLNLPSATPRSISGLDIETVEPPEKSEVESFMTETVVFGSFRENRFASKLLNQASANLPSDRNPTTCVDSEPRFCEKNASPSSDKSAEAQTSTQNNKDAMISSPVKSLLSVSKLNSSTDSKWHVSALQTGANNSRKSQDRFPFTISESASRKASKYKVVPDVSLDQLMQERNARLESNYAILTQQPILEKSDNGEPVTSNMIDTKPRIDSGNPAPFLKELTNRISNGSPQSWAAGIPFIGPNYISYGCQSKPRTLMPTVKGIMKKFSAKLRYSRAKRCQDSEEMNMEILYRNKKCRYESGEGSSSAASIYQSQFLPTNKLIRESTDSSRTSSANAVKPKRNHECIDISMKQHPKRGCDQNDMWIQDFDNDVEFDGQAKTEAMPGTSSPVNDRYSMFLARRTFSGIIDKEADHNGRLNFCEGGDSQKVIRNRTNSDDKLFSKMQDLLSKSPMPPPNSTNEFEIQTTDDELDDLIEKSECCCFRINHFFATSRKHSSKTRRRAKVLEKK